MHPNFYQNSVILVAILDFEVLLLKIQHFYWFQWIPRGQKHRKRCQMHEFPIEIENITSIGMQILDFDRNPSSRHDFVNHN